ncbi:hypothetical protein LTR56_026472 [Elasticomyces elasticus]|nr:hypothetical protein LTR56_026472 [Elasticomyces elasticus]KAK3618002.1 hypothetical protein LTR22_026524 [Elasticomyces elasticus]KAK5736084.1 hypothetical protein LTS12_026286 [Elasticomyces elasticus]
MGEAQPTQRRIDYVPTCDHGSVIITTRSKGEALKLVYESEMVDVLPMGEGDAETLLESKLGRSSGGIRPRADAAVYGAAVLYAEVEQSRASRTRLLERNVPLTNRDAEANNSVLLTWQISFDHIYSTRRSAAELLSLMSFCDRLAIPETLLRVNLDKSNEGSNGRSGFEEDIVALRSFSFVSHTASAQEWEMHRLVQDATLVWLEGHFENWSVCRTLFPHAKSAAGQRPTIPKALLEWATVMHRSAWYAVGQGALIDALAMATSSTTINTQQLGAENEVTLASTAMVAWTLRDRGQWQEAEKLEVKVMETSRRVLGGEHPSTLTSMADLASTYRDQGRWKEAEELEVKAMETSRRVLGGEHPSTLTSMANLASTYRDQGRWKEAEELEVKAMETSGRVLGGEHPSTLTSMANLASTYRDQGRWKEAEELEVKAMEKSRRVLGGKHPSTLASMANLASMYWNQGRWKKAEELEVKVIETRVRVLGGEHPSTLTSMANLAATYRDQGRWKEVEGLTSEAAEASRKVLGKTDPDTLARISAFEQIGRRDGLRTVEDGTSTAALAGDEMGSRARLALPDASFHDLVAQDEEVKQATRKKWWRKLVLDRQRSIDLLYNTISY